MNFHFVKKNPDVAEQVCTYAQEKVSEVVEKFVDNPITVSVVFDKESTQVTVHCDVHTGKSAGGVHVNQKAASYTEAIDLLSDKLKKVLRRDKDKHSSHKARRIPRDLQDAEAEAAHATDEGEV